MRIWAIIVALLCPLAHAAWEEQFSGLWLSPALPGWAASIHQQGNHAVATVLTYAADGKAKWYQAEMTLPEWDPYILWGTVSVGGALLEGGSSRKVGTAAFLFDEDHASVRYMIDGAASDVPISRFVFAPAGLHGAYTGWWTRRSRGWCGGRGPTQSVRFTASNAADNAVGLVLTSGAASCSVQATYGYSGSTPQLVGRAQCTGLDGISEAAFTADDVRIGRDTVSLNFSLGNADCGYYGPLVAARTDRRIDDDTAPHDDVSGLWKTARGWSIDAHLQGDTLFTTVLAADGSWYVAPDARYLMGFEGDFVEYAGDLWSASKTRPDDRDTRLTLAGLMVLVVGAPGDISSAGYGNIDYSSSKEPVSRMTWPREDSISGSYVGVRTSRAGVRLSVETVNVTEDAGVTRITTDTNTGDLESERCDFSGRLQWEGSIGRIDGSGSCQSVFDLRSGAFAAEEIRITEQGITMRYRLAGAFGTIAGLRH